MDNIDISKKFKKVDKYCEFFAEPLYHAVRKGEDPLNPTIRENRATCANTAGLYCTKEIPTCVAEVDEHLPYNERDIFKLKPLEPIYTLNLVSYCNGEGVAKEACYSGEKIHPKVIDFFFGMGIPALSWASNKYSGGTTIVLLVDNIPTYRSKLSIEKIF